MGQQGWGRRSNVMDEVPGSCPKAAGGWGEALCWSQGI